MHRAKLPVDSRLTFENASITVKEVSIEEGSHAYEIVPDSITSFEIHVPAAAVLMCYTQKGHVDFTLSAVEQSGSLDAGTMTIFCYPFENCRLDCTPRSTENLSILVLSIEKLHSFFGSSFGSNKDELNAFMGSFKMKQYFSSRPVNPEMAVIFHQIFNNPFSGQKLYLQGKVFEVLSHYLLKQEDKTELEKQCPFVNDHLEMEKVKAARELVLADLMTPPSFKELAKAVGTNEYKLKIGFKSMYGSSVYAYLKDFRLQRARQLIETRGLNVKQIAGEIGYSNPSHFIAAYKKKFGITPKKHLQTY